MTGVAVLSDALGKGARVVFDGSDEPRLLAPQTLHDAILANRETVKEILRRAAIFRQQAHSPGPWPILTLRGVGADGCISCGAQPASDRRYRCEVCALAVRLALESVR